jgi:hypothetical protein
VHSSSEREGNTAVSRLAGIHDLSYCFTRLGGVGSAGYSQDWLSLGANLGGMVGKALWYAKGQWPKLVDALAKSGKSVLPTPTAIVDVCMVVISVVDLFNGFGGPDKGAAFASAIDKYDTTWERLDGANPRKKEWTGPGAEAYEAQNRALMDIVKQMQDLDKKMSELMTNQANEVTKAHQCIALTCMALVLAQGIALALYMIPIVGAEISCAWQIVAAFAASATVLAFEMFTLSNSMGLVYEVQAAAEDYVDLAKDATPAPTFAKIEIAAVEETRVSSFLEISEMLKGISHFSEAPTLSALASMAPETSSEEERATFKALTSDETPGDDETPDQTPPPAPGATPPSLTDISKASGQLAQMSGHVSQHMNLVNQMMGQVQQLTQMGQGAAAPAAAKAEQAAAAGAAPAEEALAEAAPAEAALAGQTEGAGAALGTEGAERAPIDVAAAAAAAGPAERVL